MADKSTEEMNKALGDKKKHLDTSGSQARPLSASIYGRNDERGKKTHGRQASMVNFADVLAAPNKVETQDDEAVKATSAAAHMNTPGKK